MRIGIDAGPLTLKPTGVGQYTRGCLEAILPILAADESLHALSTGLAPMDAALLARLRAHRHLRVPTRAMYGVWNALRWPRVDRLLGGVDVYHATNYFLPPVQRARTVLTIYDLTFLRAPQWCSPKIVGPFSRHVRRFAHAADALLTCSEASKTDIVELLQIAPEKVTVAYGAVDIEEAAPARAAARDLVAKHYALQGPFVLFVSTLEPRKNVEGLLAAFAAIAAELPHRLVLVGGEGWNPEPVAATIARYGLEDRVTRPGYVPRAHLPAFYAAADAFALPSHYEGFGIPVLEAMHFGCPVVTTNRASLAEVAGDAAVLVDPDAPESIAGGLRRVLTEPGLAEALRARGRAQATRFTWHDCAVETLGLYRALAARG